MSEITPEELAGLKAAFSELDCTVKAIDETSFEISSSEFPIATHVFATAYFLQLATYIIARPKGFPFRTRSRLHAFLNRANLNAKVAKFTVDAEKPDTDYGGWMILASVKFVTGTSGANYDQEALKHCLLLWMQDVAELIAAPGSFGLVTMSRESE